VRAPLTTRTPPGYVEEVDGLGELCVTWRAERLDASLFVAQ